MFPKFNLRRKKLDWQNRRVLVTGGASFIGSHLTYALVKRGAKVRIVDDLSSGKLENIQQHLTNGAIEFIQANLREPGVAQMTLFHREETL